MNGPARTAGVAFVAALAVLVAPSAASASTLVSQRELTLSGTVFDTATSESVTIQSGLHLSTAASDGQATIYVNLDNTTATGNISGLSYSFVGADTIQLQAAVVPQVVPVTFNLYRRRKGTVVVLEQVQISLTFDQTGALTDASASFASLRPE
jgi:hypothetical protein